MSDNGFCSARSLAANEPLVASAPQRRIWLLLEVDAPWGAQALAESDLPPPVRQHLEDYLAATPEAGILFIRQPDAAEGIRLFVAVGDAQSPALFSFTLERYEDLLTLDFDALARGQRPECRDGQPLYLVCTHGKRDACCALAGMPMFAAMRELAGDRVWRCSHIGGHRFAPTLLFLPEGLCYGRLPLEDAGRLIALHRDGRLEPRWLRGRCVWPPPVQAAAALLRQRSGMNDISGLELQDWRQEDDSRWHVTLRAGGVSRQLRVQRRIGDVAFRSSCVGDKVAAAVDWELLPA